MTPADRFKASIVAIIEQVIPNRKFFAPARYVVRKAQNGKLDADPESKASGYPSLTGVPIRGLAAANAGSKLKVGSSVMIAWAHGDRADPFLLDVLQTPDEFAIEANHKVSIDGGAEVDIDGGVIKLNGGVQGVARVGDTVMGFMAITSGSVSVKAGT